MSKQIELTQGRVAIVDDEDFERLSQWKWRYLSAPNKRTGYAVRSAPRKTKLKPRSAVLMHRDIIDAPRDTDVDHINSNNLDNRRRNLRLCTGTQNNGNQQKYRGSSRYKGVSWHKNNQKWEADIQFEYKCFFLGLFDDEESAAQTYNEAALQHFGDFARLNIIDPNREGFAETISVLAIEPGLLHTFLPQDPGSLRL